ncbi:NADPH-dependent F420 reductase [Pleurocapsales cyanobacterium LEGE 10410]|nr:NADPH-dependent F420 reductase [Pleurocapsales cyanobacterium LEGE 10410]
MKISILGAGNVGSTLGKSWANKGHEIFFGVRHSDDEKTQDLIKDIGNNAQAGTNSEAIAFSNIIVLALPWQVVPKVLEAADLSDKIIIDVTNPLTPDFSGLEIGFNTSGAEKVAQWAKGAKVFKSFNQTGWENMANPIYEGKSTAMLVCGDDEAAKKTVLQLVSDIGFEAIDAGKLEVARLIEPFGMTWIHLAFKQGLGRDWAFQIVRR